MFVNSGSGNGLVPDGTKPLPDPLCEFQLIPRNTSHSISTIIIPAISYILVTNIFENFIFNHSVTFQKLMS